MLLDHIQSKSLLKNGTDELVNELWKVKYTKITLKDSGQYSAAMKMIKLRINNNKNNKEFIQNDGLNAIVKQAFVKMNSFNGVKGKRDTILALGKRAKNYFDTEKGKSDDPAGKPARNQRTLFHSFAAPAPT